MSESYILEIKTIPQANPALREKFKTLGRAMYALERPGQPEVRDNLYERDVNPLIHEWRKPHRNPNFTQRKNLGHIVVAPYKRGKITIKYQDEAESYDVKTLVWSSGTITNYNVSDRLGGKPTDYFPRIEYTPTRTYSNYFSANVYRVVSRYPEGMKLRFPEISVGPSTNFDDEAIEEATTSALADANSGEWDALTSLAEARETISFLAGKLLQAAELVKNYRRLPAHLAHKTQRTLKNADSAWLEYRYAIMPLVYEAQDIMSALENLGRLYKKSASKSSSSASNPIENSAWQLEYDEAQYKYKVVIKRRYDPRELINAVEQIVGFNPFVTAWELIPLSFVIDWFVNVGDFLVATTTPTYHCEQGATLGIKVERAALYSLKWATWDGHMHSRAFVTEQSYERRVIQPSATLQFGVDLNWKRTLDAFALSWGPVRKALTSTTSN